MDKINVQDNGVDHNQRLTKILEDNGMLVDDTVTPKNNLNEEVQKNISSIASFFINRDIDKMKYVDPTFTLKDFNDTFGFIHKNYYDYNNDEYYYISSEIYFQPLLVKGYEYLFNVETFSDNLKLDGYSVEMKNITTLVITKDGETIFEDDLEKEFLRIASSYEESGTMETLNKENSMIQPKDSTLDIQIILNNLNVRKVSEKEFLFESVSILVLFTP